MKAENGPTVTYELVYRYSRKPIHSLGADGYYHQIGTDRGVLVKSVSMGRVMYHKPEEMLRWKCEAWNRRAAKGEG